MGAFENIIQGVKSLEHTKTIVPEIDTCAECPEFGALSCSLTSQPFCLRAMAAVRPAKPPPATSARRALPGVLFTLAIFYPDAAAYKKTAGCRQASMKFVMAFSVISGETSLT